MKYPDYCWVQTSILFLIFLSFFTVYFFNWSIIALQCRVSFCCTTVCISYVVVLATQLCPTLCDPMDCSLLGSSVHGILQARMLEWISSVYHYIPSLWRAAGDRSYSYTLDGRPGLLYWGWLSSSTELAASGGMHVEQWGRKGTPTQPARLAESAPAIKGWQITTRSPSRPIPSLLRLPLTLSPTPLDGLHFFFPSLLPFNIGICSSKSKQFLYNLCPFFWLRVLHVLQKLTLYYLLYT